MKTGFKGQAYKNDENIIKIVVDPCKCGATMAVSNAWIEDAGRIGVIECACPECSTRVLITVGVTNERV